MKTLPQYTTCHQVSHQIAFANRLKEKSYKLVNGILWLSGLETSPNLSLTLSARSSHIYTKAQSSARARKPGQTSASGCTVPRARRPCFGAGCHPAPGPNVAPTRARSGRMKQARPHGSFPGAGAAPLREPKHTGRPQ